MNSSHWPHVTSAVLSAKGWSSTSWIGPSLSKLKPSLGSKPTFTTPPGWSIQAGVGPATVVGGWVARGRRVGAEHVLDVHEQQLLVLLLVVQAQLDQPAQGRLELGGQEAGHRVVDGIPGVGDRGDPRGCPPASQ